MILVFRDLLTSSVVVGPFGSNLRCILRGSRRVITYPQGDQLLTDMTSFTLNDQHVLKRFETVTGGDWLWCPGVGVRVFSIVGLSLILPGGGPKTHTYITFQMLFGWWMVLQGGWFL